MLTFFSFFLCSLFQLVFNLFSTCFQLVFNLFSTCFQLVFNLFSTCFTCFTFSLLALGVSYVNELNSERALRTLKLWVEHNPNFQSMEVVVDAYSDGSLMDEVMQLMISAQKAALAHGGDDSDVNIVLVRAVF
jgi:hypothetical protein